MAILLSSPRVPKRAGQPSHRQRVPLQRRPVAPQASLGSAGPPPSPNSNPIDRDRSLQQTAALAIGQPLIPSASPPPPLAEDPLIDASSGGAKLLRSLCYAVNAAVLITVGTAATAPDSVNTLRPVVDTYTSLLATHPVALKGLISGVVYGMGDVTAQAYEGRAVAQVDWGRTVRSAAIGAFAHGPLSHFVFSSKGSFIDKVVERVAVLDDWQRPLAKIAVDQTAYSLAWCAHMMALLPDQVKNDVREATQRSACPMTTLNLSTMLRPKDSVLWSDRRNSLYFGLLGALRRDEPGAIWADLRSSGFSLMKAGWRLWPIAHLLTYSLLPAEHRLLFVDTVELAWVSVLLYWGQQSTALDTEGEVAASAPDAAMAASQPQLATADSSAADEMRVFLISSSDSEDMSLDEQDVSSSSEQVVWSSSDAH